MWLRPRALFEHPQLGPLLSQINRDAGERALLTEAARVGVDLRTIERAVSVDRGGGVSLRVAAGAFDARRVIDLHWERMLPPQRRGDAARGETRIEGMLGGRPVAIVTDAACGLIARAERDPRLVDRVLDDRRTAGGEADPPEMIRWHVEGAPSTELGAAAPDALTASLRWFELRADPDAEGLRVNVLLAGPLPADTPARMTRFLSEMAASDVGRAVGADDWLAPTESQWTREGDTWRGTVLVPWRGLRAFASLSAGSVVAPNRQEF